MECGGGGGEEGVFDTLCLVLKKSGRKKSYVMSFLRTCEWAFPCLVVAGCCESQFPQIMSTSQPNSIAMW